MAGTDLGRAEYSDRNAVAQSFQCRDDGGELPVEVPRDVLAEDTIRPNFIDDAHDLIDEETVVIGTEPLAGVAVGLAGVA